MAMPLDGIRVIDWTVWQQGESQCVRQVIGELKTERDRQLLLRFYLAEDDKEQICSDLGLSSLHFNRVLFRARQRFKVLLEQTAGIMRVTSTTNRVRADG